MRWSSTLWLNENNKSRINISGIDEFAESYDVPFEAMILSLLNLQYSHQMAFDHCVDEAMLATLTKIVPPIPPLVSYILQI